jgi:ribonuclease P protein component
VFADAKAVSDDSFTILCRPNQLGHPRLGLAISKKMLARAVDRNRVKRLIRETFRLGATELAGRDFVVMARRGIRPERPVENQQALVRLWSRSVKRCAPVTTTSSSPVNTTDKAA